MRKLTDNFKLLKKLIIIKNFVSICSFINLLNKKFVYNYSHG